MAKVGGKASVETVTVAQAYPSQNYTLLNATGYVVAQRKAALSSKATGRLEWLGVLEGSKVKKDEVIARLENRDVAATLGQAQANVKVAQANLEQGQAELLDAPGQLQAQRRSAEPEIHRCRHLRHGAGAPQQGQGQHLRLPGRHRSRPRQRAGRPGGNRPDRHPRAVRRRDPDQERQRRRQHHALLLRRRQQGRRRHHRRHGYPGSGSGRLRGQPEQNHGRPAGRNPARCLPQLRLAGVGLAHGADRGPQQGNLAGQGALCRPRSARAARHERQGRVPVQGGAAGRQATRDSRAAGRHRHARRQAGGVRARRRQGDTSRRHPGPQDRRTGRSARREARPESGDGAGRQTAGRPGRQRWRRNERAAGTDRAPGQILPPRRPDRGGAARYQPGDTGRRLSRR
jgi:pyruvate/2-oxoglutarate dehydrogenase complex dihydrolipoamide acyltransferase (E2) component